MLTAAGEKLEPACDGMLSDSSNNMAVTYVCKVIASVINGLFSHHVFDPC